MNMVTDLVFVYIFLFCVDTPKPDRKIYFPIVLPNPKVGALYIDCCPHFAVCLRFRLFQETQEKIVINTVEEWPLRVT